MNNRNTEWQEEQARVNHVVNKINRQIEKLTEGASRIKADASEIRKTFWHDVTVNFDEADDIAETYTSIKQQAELLAERERSQRQFNIAQRTLERLGNSPYFGRIDFIEDGEAAADPIYLGIASFRDEEKDQFLIYDWRAPISSLYYDFIPGPAGYKTPSGLIEGEITLKRQYIIHRAQLTGMFDTGITIGDQLLIEVLGNHADTQMKSIVATIQKEQNQIIRNEKSKLLIVKGVAGSGKTSAALQRVAYLLYRYRGTLNPENILLFSPNPLFNSYVSSVLPELGEENMQQTTYQEYVSSRINHDIQCEDVYTQMEYLLTKSDDPDYDDRVKSIRFKSSLNFKELIDEYAGFLANEGLVFKDLNFRKKTLISKEQIYQYFYSFDRGMPIPNRVELLKARLLKELRKAMKLEVEQEWVEEELHYLEKEDYLEAFKQLQKQQRFLEDTFDDFERERQLLAQMIVKKRFRPLFAQMKRLKFIDMLSVYNRLFHRDVPAGIKVPEQWPAICSMTIKKLEATREISCEDTTPFLYLQDKIEGRKSNTAIRHIFIDEAQDYSPFQFAFLKDQFPYSKMTLLGDLNQAIYANATGSEPILAADVDGDDEQETIVLNRTYRSTKEIVEFTSEIIEDVNIELFNRRGRKPVLTIVHSFEQLYRSIIETIQTFLKSGHKTIAVICKTADESREAFQNLDGIEKRLIEKGTSGYDEGVLVIPAYLAKGIEFDAVIMYDSSIYQRESERKLLYTACTRAMHELHIYSLEKISPLLKRVNEQRYTLVKLDDRNN
ncbi:RNA polymerase recycling motor HelD [Bacillus sp. V3-13]|uniref:RNA polymerase recycling motor HelD n=1 Tax=Bacillus sp. V3-13 TaxID=2053728 RepID=UPI0015E1548C|nr:RNA polymerase recycling motor HelD [Bacillus sp. V3-13]